jgi:Glycosyl hydrolases family 16
MSVCANLVQNGIGIFTKKKTTLTVNSTDKSKSYSTYLELASARLDDETQEAGEITFKEFNVSHASIRVLGRVNGTPGACAGIFTYLNDTQESDIEMFTKDPDNYIHYTNNPSDTGEPDYDPIIGATANVSTQDHVSWHDWHVHRLDWTPGRTVVFVDDNQRNTSTLQVPVASPLSGIYLDMWGANSSWVGQMPVGGLATFDVQWVELLFNLTAEDSSNSTSTTAGNQKVCKLAEETSSMGVSWASVDYRRVAMWSVLLSFFMAV